MIFHYTAALSPYEKEKMLHEYYLTIDAYARIQTLRNRVDPEVDEESETLSKVKVKCFSFEWAMNHRLVE